MWKLISGQCQIHAAGAEDPSGRSDGAQSPADTPGSLSPGTHGWLSDPNLCRTGPGGERKRERERSVIRERHQRKPALQRRTQGGRRRADSRRAGGGRAADGLRRSISYLKIPTPPSTSTSTTPSSPSLVTDSSATRSIRQTGRIWGGGRPRRSGKAITSDTEQQAEEPGTTPCSTGGLFCSCSRSAESA